MTDTTTASPNVPCETARLQECTFLLILALYTAIMAAAIVTVRPLLSANDRSRWCTVWSLVERGTYRIDEIDRVRGWSTIDKVYHQSHFYSTKPPLLPTIVAGVYWCVQQTTGWDLLHQTASVTRLILILINLVPMLVALVLIIKLVEQHACSSWTRLYVLATAAFGTFLTPFLVTFNNHTVAATSVVFALYPAIRILCDGERRKRYFLLAGFWSAFVCCNELPAALFGLAMFGLLLSASRRETLRCFLPAALVPLAAFFWTNYLATGGWKPFYLYYGTEKYLYVVNGVASYWSHPKGIDRGGDSPILYFLNCTTGHHGIFSLSPVFLICWATWFAPRKCQTVSFSLRPFVWLGLGLTICVLGFYLTRTANYNYGGHTAGLRWAFWLIPFWLISLIPAIDRFGGQTWFQVTTLVFLAVSVFSAFYPIANPWQHPWLFNLLEQAGWIHYG